MMVFNFTKIFALLFLLCLLSNSLCGQNKKISASELTALDSLLSSGERENVKTLLTGDSIFESKRPDRLAQFDRDSVEAVYGDVLLQLDRSDVDTTKSVKQIEQIIDNFPDKYDQISAGKFANDAYRRLKDSYANGDSSAAYRFYVIADFLRKEHILREKRRLMGNADCLESLLRNNRQRLDAIKQSRDLGEGFGDIDEAIRLWKECVIENRDTPAFRSIAKELEQRYRGIELELAHQQSEREKEEHAEFKEIKYALGVSGGGIYSIEEKFPPYYTSSLEVGESGNAVKNSAGFWGYGIGISVSYYMHDNLSIELGLSLGKIERQRPRVYPFSGNSFSIPEYASPVTHTSFCCVVNYLLRIKTGFRVFSGFGASFMMSNAPQSQSYIDNSYPYSLYYFSSSPLGNTESIRVILRTGIEFIPGKSDILSYSFIMDGSLRITSSQSASPLLLQPSFRVSVLL